MNEIKFCPADPRRSQECLVAANNKLALDAQYRVQDIGGIFLMRQLIRQTHCLIIQRREKFPANNETDKDNEETDVHKTATRQAANLETKITLGATMMRQSNLFCVKTCLITY